MDFSEQIQEITTHINGITRQAAAKHNISFAQAQFLLRVPSEGISMSELANLLGIEISTMSRNVNKLELLQFIVRERDTEDGRTFKLSLTHSGFEIVDLLFSEIDACATEILSTIPLDLQKRIGDVLEQLNWAFTQYREK
ncbi:MAG: MarR family transcriptional regulator [Candidatus Marinimicrobia bacterium]|jgi:DNA-binding MarR family transcriptional regulator|nr:MarR family transcriptional regulator [Candidatus Neomarinimicrobiota bacterium]MBT7377832.1 MarR family transcriptional regulator [Candidatus Neomarinimicrobiota bacterium]